MRGVTVASPGAEYKVVDDLQKPSPGKGQVLVRSLFSGINPVETFMQGTGMLVLSWPIVLGCDASGEVVEIGEGVTKFKVGDGVFGCTRLGREGYGTFQEYHIMDEKLAFKKPDNVTFEQAATLGVGLLTSSLGLVPGLGVKLAPPGEAPKLDEWIIILGGSGSVGQFAIQLATLSGYAVLASCSPSKIGLCTAAGASATFDYKLPIAEQLKTVASITSGKFSKVLDAGAASAAAAMEILVNCSDLPAAGPKRFATTDDWSPISAPEGSGIDVYRIKLGQLGKYGEGESEDETCRVLEGVIPVLEGYVANGSAKPMQWEVAGTGFEGVSEAIRAFDSGKGGGKKVLVKIGE